MEDMSVMIKDEVKKKKKKKSTKEDVMEGKFLTNKEVEELEKFIELEKIRQLELNLLSLKRDLLVSKKRQVQLEVLIIDKDIRISVLEQNEVAQVLNIGHTSYVDYLRSLQTKYKLKDIDFGYDNISGKIIEEN